MSNVESDSSKRESREIVKLKVEGARMAVNTLRDQQTARGVSLVCPFPALEVDVPVSFQAGGKGDMMDGSIHRIGVEDDPETGLPRLRLSIRTNHSCSMISTEQVEQAFEEIKPSVTTTHDSPGEGPSEISSEIPLFQDDDPAWVGCTDVPMPEEFAARAKTRRRYKLAGRAVLMAAIAIFVAGGYILERTGVVDSRKIRSYIAGFSMDSIGLLDRTPVLETEAVASLVQEKAPAPLTTEVAAEVPAPGTEPGPALPAVEEAAATPAVFAQGPAKVLEASALVAAEPAAEANLEVEVIEELAAGTDPEEAVLMLPTRWPVEYATGYRVRNPNGIVVDIPGGLVKREGWIESAASHDMVRSVKAVQRETGARFIVYVHGNLPRFMTSPKPGGVALRLYHPDDDATATDEVAVLD